MTFYITYRWLLKNHMKEKKQKGVSKGVVIGLVIAAIFLTIAPFFALRGAEFGGSDDAGSVMVDEITGGYEPWFTPVLETAIGGELPGEIESLFFCLQTAIGVGTIAFIMGRFVERKKWMPKEEEEEEKTEA